jgi:hypothetical protein
MGIARVDKKEIDPSTFYCKPALQEAGARYNNSTITITRMITIKRPIMMTFLVLGGPMKDRSLKFDCLHGIRCTACTFQALVSVR